MQETDWRAVALEGGLYTVPQAAGLLATKNTKVRSWIEGYPHSGAQPILRARLPRLHKGPVLTFLDLVESAWVAHFLGLGYSPQTVRKVANKLREQQNVDHPFAYKNRFMADGKHIFEEVVGDDGERRLVSLMDNKFMMPEVIKQSLFDRIFYVDDIAAEYPPIETRPAVVLNPKIAFGKPVLKNIWVPTRVLYDAYKAEDSNATEVAEEYGVPESSVMDAVGFERELRERTLH